MTNTSALKNVVKDVSENKEHKEGAFTKRVESQTAKVPSIGYLGLAVGSMVLSAGLVIFAERKEYANFVGLWAPAFMLLGIYNKLVKLEGGSDSTDKKSAA
ncbi:MAG: hypothetical protein H7222_12680 [Methylotenera sp.]|nr:hypothetical protein [Oligoflexia bacterium]